MGLPTVNRTDPIAQTSWQSGMITSSPPEELPTDAAQLLLNLEFDSDSNLVTRNGVELFLDTNLSNERITSLFRAQYSDGTVFIYFTAGTELYRCTEAGASLTTITGGLTLPDDVFWQWVMFDDFAIGTNGTEPIKVNSSGTASLLNASAPDANYCEVWNSRLWLSGVGDEGNTIFGSAINDPEDWTVDDDAGAIVLGIDIGDGDFITGIKALREALFVYKRRKINIVSAISSPATIPTNLRTDIYTSNIGCESAWSIQNVLDDQLFLSALGIVSLSLAPLGELKGAIVSENIAELSLLKKNTDEIPSLVLDDMNQYWISIPSTISDSGLNEVWVLDYQKINQRDEKGFPIVRWVKFNGLVAGTAYCEKLDGDYKSYLIATYPIASTDTNIYQYTPNDPDKLFSDNGVSYTQDLLTKAYIGTSSLLRSLWVRFGLALKLFSETLNLNVNYFFDNKRTSAGSYGFIISGTASSTSLYGTALYGTATWASISDLDTERTIWRSVRKNGSGRKARTFTLGIRCNTVEQGFIFKFIQIEQTPLNFRRARSN